jgi:hypothetical protein
MLNPNSTSIGSSVNPPAGQGELFKADRDELQLHLNATAKEAVRRAKRFVLRVTDKDTLQELLTELHKLLKSVEERAS